MIARTLFYATLALGMLNICQGQEHAVTRNWNEATLHAIRQDFARPTVHARNLFHVSIAIYDAWAVFDSKAETYLLGKDHGDFVSDFDFSLINKDGKTVKQQEAISYAVYRLLTFRFQNSPGHIKAQASFDSLMTHYNYSIAETSIDYTDGKASSLGNFIATEIIRYGLQDGSNEQNGFANQHYHPINEPLIVTEPGNPSISDPNRWQPLQFKLFIDQSGNTIPGSTPAFLSPEWGNVKSFSFNPGDIKTYTRDEHNYLVYHDPGNPPYLKEGDEESIDGYQWGFGTVSRWSAHLDPTDEVMWDISPASIGNIQDLPHTLSEYKQFYDPEGGDWSEGYEVNPVTNQPYEPQIVPRGDYTRVLAEFWADGPSSETPPGHWFTILNYVMDHELFERNFKGESIINDPVEYEAKAYFTLGAAMHDVAIAAWAIKGWYDYLRPVSALRYMGDQGQSSDSDLPNYHKFGMQLVEGFVELVQAEDPLVGDNSEHLNKIKLKAWKGPDFIDDPATDEAGVGWVLAENWWPYQRPTFVTPPFAGYISGHSTYSRAAAEILTALTGTPYFPGGMGEFLAPKNEFLVFEQGPSMDVTLQWATYRDASDQCSLSRIWGGIHPPADDIPGRIIGQEIATDVFELAEHYFNGAYALKTSNAKPKLTLFPNPCQRGQKIHVSSDQPVTNVEVFTLEGVKITSLQSKTTINSIPTDKYQTGCYFIRINSNLTSRMLIK
ncbi:MAG: T9SS type A sorting domain-containing protein [Marinoscillum sp.]